MSIMEEALELRQKLIDWRRDLHRIPEIDIALPLTTAYIEKELKALGIQPKVYPEISCIAAVIGSGSRCLLLRSDIDGLPMVEKSGEPFASENGCAHACGHDLHAATLLGAAALLKAHEQELKCTVKLLFQSGEETFHGAAAAIAAGIMEEPHVDAAFAMHAFAADPVGTFMYGPIPLSSAYGFTITLTGKGGHGSQPDACIDPINAAVQVYLALQSLVAREASPRQPVSLTIGHFTAGAAANVIPDTAILEGTMRTFDPQTREQLIRRITEVGRGVAETYRCGFELRVNSDVPSLVSDPDFSEACIASLQKLGIADPLAGNLQAMGSEDFAFFSQLVPSCYITSGAGVPEKERRCGQHDPRIVFNEDSLPGNAAVYAQVALDFE